MSEERGRRKVRQGVVVSAANDKTIVVQVKERKPHRVYKKMMTSTKKFHAHDEGNIAGVGDTVRILDGPLSSFTGTVESIDIDNNSVSLLVSMFGRETSVEFQLDEVEVVSP